MNLKTEIRDRVKKECAAEIQTLREAVANWFAVRDQLTVKCLLPGQAQSMIETLEKQHGQEAHDAHIDRMDLHVDTLARLRAIVFSKNVQLNAVRKLNGLFLALAPLFETLEIAAEKSIDSQLASIRQRENEFFAGFGLPSEETTASRIALAERARIRAHGYAHARTAVLNSPHGDNVPAPDLAGLHFLFDDVTPQPSFGVQAPDDVTAAAMRSAPAEWEPLKVLPPSAPSAKD